MSYLLNRRSFLKTSVAAATLLRTAPAAPGEIRWALLSDTHIAADPADTYRGFQPSANLTKVVAQVTAKPFDAIIVNGDLARLEGKPADYDRFATYATQLAGHAPLIVTLGNHDTRATAQQSLTKLAGTPEPITAKWVTTHASGPLQFIFLDSLLATNIAPGQVGKAQTDWLTNHLAHNQTKPAIVFVHHNPDPDSDNALVDAARLLAVLKPARHVKALIFGHTHEYKYAQTEGLHLINLPAVGYNFTDGQPVGWVEATFRPTGGSLTLHALAGETSLNDKQTNLTWR